jgi:hypothetical protein
MDIQENLVVEESEIIKTDTAWKAQVLVIGGVIGALTGLGAAYLLIQRSIKRGEMPNLGALEGIKLALLVFGLLRQVSLLGGDEK